jgi:hypothetical protein
MQHNFIRELVEFKFKAIRTATKKAKLFIEYDNSMVWIPNYMIFRCNWDKENNVVRVLSPKRHLVSIINQPREERKYRKRKS